MPNKDDAPEMAVCDGCGMEKPADDLNPARVHDAGPVAASDMSYCDACAERRADDPSVTIQGRTMPYSELEVQAEDDEHLAAALKGDSVQDQIKAANA